MAYFLDPELAALCERQRPTTTRAKVTPNKFAGMCHRGCGTKVQAGQGSLEKIDGAWKVYHLAC